MKCSQCYATDTKVIESRDAADGETIRRRRACLKCHHRFTTYERIERPQLVVVKNSGIRELFNRQKLLAGLYRASEKTPVTTLQLERLVHDVEVQLTNSGDQEIKSSKIGDLVMDRLADLNEVAYVRFASVYRRFRDIQSFERELTQFKQEKSKDAV